MPSNKEIEELQKQYPNMRVWGVDFNSFRENPRLGDILVIPFYDVIDALAACEQRVLDAAEAVVAEMPTAFWINANTTEAQEHKANVRAAIRALREKP